MKRWAIVGCPLRDKEGEFTAKAQLESPAPVGISAECRCFPQYKASGLKVDEDLSPALIEKLTYLGTKLPSFRDAHEALDHLLRTKLSLKRVERQTERIGAERVAQREAEIATWVALPLVQRDQAPPGVAAPEVAAVLADGHRLQLCEENAAARPRAASKSKSHWHEDKAGVLQILKSDTHPGAPCAPLPEVYLRPEKIDKLAREITTRLCIKQVGSPISLPPLPTVGMAFGGDVAVGRGPG